MKAAAACAAEPHPAGWEVSEILDAIAAGEFASSARTAKTAPSAPKKSAAAKGRPAQVSRLPTANDGLPAPLVVASASNASYGRRAAELRELALAVVAGQAALADLENGAINGVNTYARMVRSYRDALVAAVKAQVAP